MLSNDLIAFVDDDDEWLPEKLEKQIEVYNRCDDSLGIIYTWTDEIDYHNRVSYKYRSTIEDDCGKNILWNCSIPSPSVLVTRRAIESTTLFDTNLPSCQDWDMWTRIILNGYKCKVVKTVLSLNHKHGSFSIGTSKNAKKGFFLYFRKHFMNAFKKNYKIPLYYIYLLIRIYSKKSK